MTDLTSIHNEISPVADLPHRNKDEGILASYQGERPPYPAWALTALEDAPVVTTLTVDGADIEILTWGKAGDPGVLLLHGNGASADWWRFIAPSLAKSGKHVVALSFSGMGGSQWRETYTMDTFVREIMAVIDVTKLATPTCAPVIVGHSFGGYPALMASLRHSDKIGGLILLDTSIEPPGEEWTGPPVRTGPNRVYNTMTDALARFRLAPPQPCDNHWALDYIARTSLKSVEGGWTWKFDPFLWNNFNFEPVADLAKDLQVPTIIMRGATSYLMADKVWTYMKSIFPDKTGYVTIPQANHHLMLDQPIATIAALEAALAGFSLLPTRLEQS